MGIARLIHRNIADLITIIKLGRNKLSVEFRSPGSANSLCEAQPLQRKGYDVFIPNYRVKRIGVITDVDPDLSDDEVLIEIQREFPNCESIHRCKRRDMNADSQTPFYQPTGTVFATFLGQYLPEEVKIWFVLYHVSSFVQKVITAFWPLGQPMPR